MIAAIMRLSLFSSKQCIIKQLLDSVFVISGIIKVLVRLTTLTLTLIIPEITKTSSNNCLLTLAWASGLDHEQGWKSVVGLSPVEKINIVRTEFCSCYDRQWHDM